MCNRLDEADESEKGAWKIRGKSPVFKSAQKDNQSLPKNWKIQMHPTIRIRRISKGGLTEKSLGHCC